jgi:HlyD family secretion protein
VTATTAAPAQVRVARATVGTMQATISLSGDLRPADQIEVTPRISSRITRLAVNVGQSVRAGDLIAELDRTSLEVELTRARATLAREQAALAKLRVGPRAEDIAREEANLRAAEAKLAQAQQGPRPEDIDGAVQKLSQARDTRTRTASQLALAKEQARIAYEQAVISLEATQATFGAAKLIYDEASRTGKDPNVASCPKDNKSCNDLTDIKLRQYKAAFESASLQMRAAEETVKARQLAYEDARRQEIAGVQIEASKIQEAAANVEKARRGPDADDVVVAEAGVEMARAALAKAQAPVVEPDIQAAEASIRTAEAAVRLAEVNLGETRVVAPFAGIITQRNVSVGSVVSSSTSIVQLVSQVIEIRLNADDFQVAFLEPGQRADVRLNAYPNTTFPARVESISPSANLTSRTFTATLVPETPDTRLKPGMLAQAEVAAINRSDVLMIPEQAVIARAAETTVFVVQDGKARRKAITLGVRGGGMVEVVGGLSAGETVVIDGQTALNDNDQVSVAG